MKSNSHRGTLRHSSKFARFSIMTLCLAVGIGTFYCESVYAERTVTVRVKIKSWRTTGHILPAPDEEGHVMAIGQREGEVDFDGKETAKYESTTMLDGWMGKKGIYKGYTKYTFKDGSAIFFSWTAEGRRNKEGLPTQHGSGTLQKGTGRFEGIRGMAVFSAIQLKPTSEDPNRTSITEALITYTLH